MFSHGPLSLKTPLICCQSRFVKILDFCIRLARRRFFCLNGSGKPGNRGRCQLVSLPQNGGCVCGSVRYRLGAAPLLAYACHCHECQKRSGSAFSLALIVRSSDLSIMGELEVLRSSLRSGSELELAFCGSCRSRVFSRATAAPEFATVRAGTLDDASWVIPIAQTWIESAIPWAVIPGVRSVPWDAFDFEALGREWTSTAPEFR
jgi:hypothetical protein